MKLKLTLVPVDYSVDARVQNVTLLFFYKKSGGFISGTVGEIC
jgi:hypothetical protein